MVFNVMPEAKIQFKVEKISLEKGKGKELTELYGSSQNMGLIVSYRTDIVLDIDVSQYQHVKC